MTESTVLIESNSDENIIDNFQISKIDNLNVIPIQNQNIKNLELNKISIYSDIQTVNISQESTIQSLQLDLKKISHIKKLNLELIKSNVHYQQFNPQSARSRSTTPRVIENLNEKPTQSFKESLSPRLQALTPSKINVIVEERMEQLKNNQKLKAPRYKSPTKDITRQSIENNLLKIKIPQKSTKETNNNSVAQLIVSDLEKDIKLKIMNNINHRREIKIDKILKVERFRQDRAAVKTALFSCLSETAVSDDDKRKLALSVLKEFEDQSLYSVNDENIIPNTRKQRNSSIKKQRNNIVSPRYLQHFDPIIKKSIESNDKENIIVNNIKIKDKSNKSSKNIKSNSSEDKMKEKKKNEKGFRSPQRLRKPTESFLRLTNPSKKNVLQEKKINNHKSNLIKHKNKLSNNIELNTINSKTSHDFSTLNTTPESELSIAWTDEHSDLTPQISYIDSTLSSPLTSTFLSEDELTLSNNSRIDFPMKGEFVCI